MGEKWIDLRQREPPDFSRPNWHLESVRFHYFREDKEVRIKDLLFEDITQKTKYQLKNYEQDPNWFGTIRHYVDIDKDNYANRYRQYGYDPEVRFVVGSQMIILKKAALLCVAFLAPGDRGGSKRSYSWFLDNKNRWQAADPGYTVGSSYYFDPKGRCQKAVFKIFDVDDQIKNTLEIKKNPR